MKFMKSLKCDFIMQINLYGLCGSLKKYTNSLLNEDIFMYNLFRLSNRQLRDSSMFFCFNYICVDFCSRTLQMSIYLIVYGWRCDSSMQINENAFNTTRKTKANYYIFFLYLMLSFNILSAFVNIKSLISFLVLIRKP